MATVRSGAMEIEAFVVKFIAVAKAVIPVAFEVVELVEVIETAGFRPVMEAAAKPKTAVLLKEELFLKALSRRRRTGCQNTKGQGRHGQDPGQTIFS